MLGSLDVGDLVWGGRKGVKRWDGVKGLAFARFWLSLDGARCVEEERESGEG